MQVKWLNAGEVVADINIKILLVQTYGPACRPYLHICRPIWVYFL